MTRMYDFPSPDGGGEPARDARLGALLRTVCGEVPMGEVDWSALAGRVGAAVRAPRALSWWDQVEHWRRRALPLALAAGLVGALTFWQATRTEPQAMAYTGPDLVTSVVSGASPDEAALTFARSVTGTVELVSSAAQ